MRKDLASAVEYVRQGFSYSEAARVVGAHVNRNMVAGACHRAGVKQGRKHSKKGGHRNRPAPRSELAAKLYQQGLTYKEINERMGLGPKTCCVTDYVKRAGVPLTRKTTGRSR